MVFSRIPLRARSLALVPLGALAVHQLRYSLAFGDRASHTLATQGHAYLVWLDLAVALVAAALLGGFVGRLARARHGATPGRAGSWSTTWLVLAAGLLVTFVVQESLEGLLSAGHPAGVAGVLGGGGWIAAPASLAVAAVLTLALRGAHVAVALVASRGMRARLPRRAHRRPLRPRSLARPRLAPLASAAAGRAPPTALPSAQ